LYPRTPGCSDAAQRRMSFRAGSSLPGFEKPFLSRGEGVEVFENTAFIFQRCKILKLHRLRVNDLESIEKAASIWAAFLIGSYFYFSRSHQETGQFPVCFCGLE